MVERFVILAAALAGACSAGPSLNVQPAPTTGSAGQCATCHMSEFTSAPEHEGVKPTTCATCHTQQGWHATRLQHAWPLTGAHTRAKCFYCHKGRPPVFLGTPRQCYGCHRADYERAPRHVAEHFSTRCEKCHVTSAWNSLLPGRAMSREREPASLPSQKAAKPKREPRAAPKKVRKVVTPRPVRTTRPRVPQRRPDVTSGASRHR